MVIVGKKGDAGLHWLGLLESGMSSGEGGVRKACEGGLDGEAEVHVILASIGKPENGWGN